MVKKAVFYGRYSPGREQSETSIEQQFRAAQEYAEREGYSIVGKYVDSHLSGKNDNRPDFQRMIRDSARHEFNYVLVWKLDRFARNRYDSAIYKKRLEKNGVKVISITELISDSPEGAILESVLEGFAEYYSKQLSMNVKRGVRENFLNGEFYGGTRPLGYKIVDKKVHIDEEEAAVVRHIFKKYANGTPPSEIVRELNAKGIKTSRGNKFNKTNSVTTLIKNKVYIGISELDGEVSRDIFPPIVSEELFRAAQKRIEENRQIGGGRGKARYEYALSGKVYCKCGARMFGECGTGRNGTVHLYYKCGNAKGRFKTCNERAIKTYELDNLVFKSVMRRVMNSEAVIKIANGIMKHAESNESNMITVLERRQSEVTKSINNLVRLHEDGLGSRSTLTRLRELEKESDSLEEQIATERILHPQIKREEVIRYLRGFIEMERNSDEFVKAVFKHLVSAVRMHEKSAEVILNLSTLGEFDEPESVRLPHDKVDSDAEHSNHGEFLFANYHFGYYVRIE